MSTQYPQFGLFPLLKDLVSLPSCSLASLLEKDTLTASWNLLSGSRFLAWHCGWSSISPVRMGQEKEIQDSYDGFPE